MKDQKVLHIGWGFIPWRGGGLVEYTQDLMHFQARLGWDVSYFFAGRKYPFQNKPRLKMWRMDSVNCFEIINSPIIHGGDLGTCQPKLQLNEPISEEIFRKVICLTKPNIVHFHELSGLPSSLIEILKKDFKIPCVMTLADYYLLCPTLKLFDSKMNNCHIKLVRNECIDCCRFAPNDNRKQIVQTILYKYKSHSVVKCAPRRALSAVLKLINEACRAGGSVSLSMGKQGDLFFQRRETNLRRLKLVDQLIARSRRVEDIYRNYLGESFRNLITINPHLLHIDQIKIEKIPTNFKKIHFVTLNGLVSVQKGARLILDAISILNAAGLSDRFILHVFGSLGQEFEEEVFQSKSIHYYGEYTPDELNDILSGKHAGILPSVWEEVFGYVGPEMLSKGLPLIANKIGGITEYALDGENAILNYSCSSEELAKHMEKAILNPEILVNLNKKIISKASKKRTYQQHFLELNAVYNLVSSNIPKGCI